MALATGWFIAPYRRKDPRLGQPGRENVIEDFNTQIKVLDGGVWGGEEGFGNSAIIWVRANASTLTAIDATQGVTGFPGARLDDLLGTLLSQGRLNAVHNKLNALGFTDAEILSSLGTLNLALASARQVFALVLSRRFSPRYDAPSDTIVLDGAPITPTAIDVVALPVPL